MVETTKQVRVDNWGIYFLQRLQLFFSKTDYCDLTLQFEGNTQLKVHRLVMDACTEYFSFLEQNCPSVEENTIIMPADLQSDVIVPIVNFMYTGMLEFPPSIFDKLYNAAATMNIAVLTKLLEAQSSSIHKMNRIKKEKEKTTWRDIITPTINTSASASASASLAATESSSASSTDHYSRRKGSSWRKRNFSGKPQSHPSSATFHNSKWSSDLPERDSLFGSDNTPKPTRFEWPEDDLTAIPYYPSSHDVSLTSKPLWTKEDDHNIDPPEDKLQIMDSKSSDYDEKNLEKVISQMEETISNACNNSTKRKAEGKLGSSWPKKIKITNNEDETIISIITSKPNEIDHTKIVSEVFKKYPELGKKNRSIKLKITQAKGGDSPNKDKNSPKSSSSSSQQELIDHKNESDRSTPSREYSSRKKGKIYPSFRASSEEGPWTCLECSSQDREGTDFVLYYLFRKHMSDQHSVEFDSSLCKYCGKKCTKENVMTYHLYTKHGLKPPRSVTFPKCTLCPFIAVTNERLQEHIEIHGKDEIQCTTCQLGFLTKKHYLAHRQMAGTNHKNSSILDCNYCKKKLQNPVTLFTHIRGQHMREARRDGITSLDEVMDVQNEEIEDDPTTVEIIPEFKKTGHQTREMVKVISNVKMNNKMMDSSNKVGELENSADSVAVSSSGELGNIEGSLATNLAGLVDIVVLDDNQQYILQQPEGQSGSSEFILQPELTGNQGILQAASASGNINSTDELVMVLTDHDFQDDKTHQGVVSTDNSNIVVLYSHPVEGEESQFISSHQGNIMLNSEGMIEIRDDESGLTTTTTTSASSSGPILVNNGNTQHHHSVNTTTTLTTSVDSPIESIDLIRKEIEASNESTTTSTKVSLTDDESTKITENLLKKDDVASQIIEDIIINEADHNKDEPSSSEVAESVNEVDNSNNVDDENKEIKEEEILPIQNKERAEQSSSSSLTVELKEMLILKENRIGDGADVEKTDDHICEAMNVDDDDDATKSKEEESEIVHSSIDDDEIINSENLTEENADNIHDAETEVHQFETVNQCENNFKKTTEKSNEEEEEEESAAAAAADHQLNDLNEDAADEAREALKEFIKETEKGLKNEKIKNDLNKDILDDWEDTDSQPAHAEDVKVTIKAGNGNVNKQLIDDWEEEEDEDPSAKD